MYEQSAIQALAVLISVIFLGKYLRQWGLLKESDGSVFTKIIINVTIPALIFSALSKQKFDPDKLMLAVTMIISQLTCAFLAWGISVFFKMSRPRRGALILASTFTSSAFLGYAVVKEVFSNNSKALADAAIVSELGVATILFTYGVFIAMHFGSGGNDKASRTSEILKFFYSPIFIALVSGIGISFVNLPEKNILISSFYMALTLISNANTFLVALTIGVMLNFKDLRKVWWIVLIAILIKLIIQPLLSYTQAVSFGFPPLWHEIVVLESAMPTAAMTAVFAKRYNCDSELTSILIFATFISSCVTMFMMVLLLN